MNIEESIINLNERILVTGSNGFVGTKVIETLLDCGYANLCCFVRPTGNLDQLEKVVKGFPAARIEIYRGNLLSRGDCNKAAKDAAIVFHLAAGIDKSFPGAFMNSVVTTRNLLDAVLKAHTLKRFLNISSLAVYSNLNMPRKSLLDENCEVDRNPERRYEAYAYGKYKQDQLVLDYSRKYNLPYVIVRPSVVFGPGKKFIPARVGIDTFGVFFHLGSSIQIPLTYVDNCAEAIVLAGLKKGFEGEVFNIVDDELPTGREFLRLYKKNVKRFFSIYIPYRVFYLMCGLWEGYSKWSKGQLPPVFNRRRCAVYWKGNRYSNEKLKRMTGWHPKVSFPEALNRYFKYQKEASGS